MFQDPGGGGGGGAGAFIKNDHELGPFPGNKSNRKGQYNYWKIRIPWWWWRWWINNHNQLIGPGGGGAVPEDGYGGPPGVIHTGILEWQHT